MTEPLHVHFEDIEIGQVIPLGACAVDEQAMDVFVEWFAPGWDVAYGAPDALVYALWSRLSAEKAGQWAGPRPCRSTVCGSCATRRPASCCAGE